MTTEEHLNQIEQYASYGNGFILDVRESLTALRQHIAEMQKVGIGNALTVIAKAEETQGRNFVEEFMAQRQQITALRQQIAEMEHRASIVVCPNCVPTLPNPQSLGVEARASNGLPGEAEFRAQIAELNHYKDQRLRAHDLIDKIMEAVDIAAIGDRASDWDVLDASVRRIVDERERLTTERDQAKAQITAQDRRIVNQREDLTKRQAEIVDQWRSMRDMILAKTARIASLEAALETIIRRVALVSPHYEIARAALSSTEAPQAESGSPLHPPRSEESAANRESEASQQAKRNAEMIRSWPRPCPKCGRGLAISKYGRFAPPCDCEYARDESALPIRASNQEDAPATKGLPDIAGAGTEEPQ